MHRAWVIISLLAIACGGSEKPPPDRPAKLPAPADAGPTMLGTEEEIGEVRDVEFTTEDGVIIHGTLSPGPARIGDEPQADGAVLLVHQLGSSRLEWAAFVPLLAEGHTVLSIDLRGHGESQFASDGIPIDAETFSDEDWAKTVLDVRAAVSYLRDLQPAPSSVTLVGSSIGSSAIFLYAAEDPNIDGLALISPGLSYRGMSTLSAAAKVKAKRILLVAMSADKDSAKAARKLGRKLKGSTVRIFEGDGHGVTMRGPLVPEIVELVKAASQP